MIPNAKSEKFIQRNGVFMKKDVNFSYYYWTENLVLKSCSRTYHEEYPVELGTKLLFTYLVDDRKYYRVKNLENT